MSQATAPSWQDLYDIGRATAISRNPKLKVNQGDVTDAIIAGAASMASVLISFAANRFLATFLAGAKGVDLTNLARDRGVERDEGDYAIGKVTLARPNASLGAGTIPTGTRVATQVDSTGAFSIYTTDVDTVYSGTDLSHDVSATCTKIGTQGNVNPGAISRILDVPAFDPTFTVTNTNLFAGGAPMESDDDLRDRVRGFFLTLARGTIDALKYGAKTVAGVKRVNVVPNYTTGIVSVYVSDADGNANSAMTDAVLSALQNHWADAGDVINVIGATVTTVTVNLSLVVRSGVDATALLDRVRNAVVARLQRLNPGETLYRDMISAAARDVDRENIVSVTVNAPAVDTVPSSSEVLRTDVSHVNFT